MIVRRTKSSNVFYFSNPYTLNSSFGRSCLGPYGGPTFTSQIFGNENNDGNVSYSLHFELFSTHFQVLNSTAVIVSIPLSSRADVGKMKAWEKVYRQHETE